MKIEDITNYVTNKFKMQIATKVIVKFVIVPRKRNYIKIYKIQKLALLLFYNRGNANDITSNAFSNLKHSIEQSQAWKTILFNASL